MREQITLDGVPVHIIDTGRLRETDDVVEQIGIERSRKAVAEADVALILIDPAEGLNRKTQDILQQLPPSLKKSKSTIKLILSSEAPSFQTACSVLVVRIPDQTFRAKPRRSQPAQTRAVAGSRLAGRKRKPVPCPQPSPQRPEMAGNGTPPNTRFPTSTINLNSPCRTPTPRPKLP